MSELETMDLQTTLRKLASSQVALKELERQRTLVSSTLAAIDEETSAYQLLRKQLLAHVEELSREHPEQFPDLTPATRAFVKATEQYVAEAIGEAEAIIAQASAAYHLPQVRAVKLGTETDTVYLTCGHELPIGHDDENASLIGAETNCSTCRPEHA